MTSYTIGRDDGNDIVIEELSVSRRHAQLVDLGDGRFRLVDVGSANGSYVQDAGNWREFKEAEIASSERLLLGGFETTAGDLLRRMAQPAKPGSTVLANAEVATVYDRSKASGKHDAKPTPAARQESLGDVWRSLPDYQKVALIVGAAVVGILIVGAAVIGALRSA
ncbi:MAG: FHA domain-containing protein [Hyphomicrobiales bacterium]|nr:FHA domain-containing protein [Hyphomicrobiales bacterium]